MTAPVPHDPRQPQFTPEKVDAEVATILNEPTSTLVEEAEQLARAHEVVHQALQ
ncbi:hypothetical protein [Corynebacterium epidermidicanis]|uniref:hypothetical protein n=1 Tax=Corynebacterium epidermidicanis TaxID=1050174 RepID=UPI000A5BC77D|nr:hypothetical protein [Corynebacterium epidermidicanis]